jgi:hypothetical protein
MAIRRTPANTGQRTNGFAGDGGAGDNWGSLAPVTGPPARPTGDGDGGEGAGTGRGAATPAGGALGPGLKMPVALLAGGVGGPWEGEPATGA